MTELKWISVDDRLPDVEFGYFLVSRRHHTGSDSHVAYSFFIKDRDLAREGNEYYSRKYQGKNSVHFGAAESCFVITHWMPLPEAPSND